MTDYRANKHGHMKGSYYVDGKVYKRRGFKVDFYNFHISKHTSTTVRYHEI